MEFREFPEVPIEKLRWRCDPDVFEHEDFEKVVPFKGLIGQPRAMESIRMGLELKSLGYNIFVAGLEDSNRIETIKSLLEELKKNDRQPNDICYVNNFKNPDNPRVLILKAGLGKEFSKDIDELIASLKQNIPMVFERDDYQKQKREIVERYQEKQRTIYTEFEGKVKKENFSLIKVQMGPFTRPDIVPQIAGNPMDLNALEGLVKEEKFSAEELERLKKVYTNLSVEMESFFKETRKLEKEIQGEFKNLDKEVIAPLVKDSIGDIREKYDEEKLNLHLKEVEEDILTNIDKFREKPEQQAAAAAIAALGQQVQLPGGPGMGIDQFREYRVNVLVDNSEAKGAPIVIEPHPSYRNIFGTIERAMDFPGTHRTDFLNIKAGSFLQANGGYLVIDAVETLIEAGVWQSLKRTLKHRGMEIQNYDPFYFFTGSGMKPEPIQVNVKVVMVGTEMLYQLLLNYDEDFGKIFKVKADFDFEMKNSPENLNEYVKIAKKICGENELLPMDKTGLAGLVEFGVRQASRQKKISSRYQILEDIMLEADYWARQNNSEAISDKHIDEAIEHKIYRHSMYEEKIKEMIEDGIIMIDTAGARVGQVNGLAVYSLGGLMFGKPSRITTTTSMGRAGIINIEREADMSGKTHNKGVLILSGYLRGKYAQDKPLSLSASLCFEQSYSGVDGDSASSTELYAILSSLADKPLRQDIAVTGSVNQNGEIQAIGGVNHKIEGFFDTCRVLGLTGNQGVLVPESNVGDLMLRKDVVDSVKERRFHIYPVKTIDQGITVLTGVEAGEADENGKYPEGTINCLVDKRLRELAEGIKEFGGGEEEKKEGKKSPSCDTCP
jgi:lon-related putative ATP-dependent protease